MTPLEQLFRLEVEFHRRLRLSAERHAGAAAAHTSFALQRGYENLIRAVGKPTGREVDVLAERLGLAGDTRDILAARDSLKQLLGIPLLDP